MRAPAEIPGQLHRDLHGVLERHTQPDASLEHAGRVAVADGARRARDHRRIDLLPPQVFVAGARRGGATDGGDVR